MPKASPIQTNFSSGEISPLLDGRVDLEEYASACKVLENFIPVIQGPAVRRGGTRHVEETKNSGKAGTLKFEFSTDQAYTLVIGDLYMWFFTDHGQVESSPGVPLYLTCIMQKRPGFPGLPYQALRD